MKRAGLRGWTGLAAGVLALVLPAVVAAQSSHSPYTSATRYDAMGRVTGTISADPDGDGPQLHQAVRTTYDAAGRPKKVETGTLAVWKSEAVAPKNWGAAFQVLSSAETEYDVHGRKVQERLRGSDGIAVSLTEYGYDALGRLECTAVRMNPDRFGDAPGDACALKPQGNQGPDRITRNVYDAAGQVLQVRRAVGTPIEQAEVTYSYTPNGKIQYVIDANGNRAKLDYDGFDRQTHWTFPSKARPASFDDSTYAAALATAGNMDAADYEAYTYDANGNRLSLRKRDGSTISYTYDALNRMKRKDLPDRADLDAIHERDVNYAYDLRGLQTEARFGTPGVFTGYDGFGRIASVTDTMDGRSLSLAHGYDRNGNRTSLTHPDGASFGYRYDDLNRLARITQPGLSLPLVNAYYNERGLLDRLKQVTNTLLGYDSAGRLASLYHGMEGTSADVATSFARNPAGQITSEGFDNNAYAWPGHVDIARNYAVNGLNQYTGAGQEAFTYDANGNLTSATAPGPDGNWRTVTYLYDHENRLVKVTTPRTGGGEPYVTEMRYDPLGRLYRIDDSERGRTTFLHDGDALIAEYGAGGVLTRRYIHGADAGADDPLVWYEGAGVTDAERRFLRRDARGSIVAVSDHLGNPIAINAYDEYGIPEQAGIAAGAADNLGRFQYTGQLWIPEVGLYYYKARWYSPTLGRFLQTDPVGYEDQFNLYAYVGNDPVNGVDPTGTEAASITCTNDACGGELSAEQLANVVETIGVIWDVATIWTGVGSGPEGVVVSKAAARAIREGSQEAAQTTSRGAAHGTRAGKPHIRAAIRVAKERNAAGNGGRVRCTRCDKVTTPTTRRTRGSRVNPREGQGEHIYPRSRGGDGATVEDQRNIDIKCAKCNREKRDTIPDEQ